MGDRVTNILLSIAGTLIVLLLGVLSWFLINMASDNKSQHGEMMKEVKLIQEDINDIKLIIIEYHPNSIDHFYNYNTLEYDFPQSYEKFNCIVNYE